MEHTQMRIRRRWLMPLVGMLAIGGASGMSARGPQASAPTVKAVPYAAISSVDGKDNFAAYCAVCHGLDGKGQGPAAPAMKAPMPDLTILAARGNGKFDAAAVEYAVRGTGKMSTPAHGTAAMPVWGAVFGPTPGDRAVSDMRIHNLVQYVASIQR